MVEINESKLEGMSQIIAETLVEKSVRPVVEPTAVKSAIATSLQHGTPLRCRMVLCPNWQVDKQGRSIGEIPVWTEGIELVYGDPSLKIISFLGQEIPELVGYLNRNGLRTELLVVLADILSPGWVHDPQKARANMAQNRKALKLLLMSTEGGRKVFHDKTKNKVVITSQLDLAGETEGYEQMLLGLQADSLQMGTSMNMWYLHVIQELQEMGEYADKRTGVGGLRKIWERALFLSTLYALDGMLVEGDFTRGKHPRFTDHGKPQGYIELGAVATGHGDIIAHGLNVLREQPIGMVTPFHNAMEHSWSETRVSPIGL